MLVGWVMAFALTQAIEVPIYVRSMRPRWSSRRALAVAFGASSITHPIVWFVLPSLSRELFAAMAARRMEIVHEGSFRWVVYAGICEGFAVVAEAIYLRALGAPRPLFWSFVANFASAVVGLSSSLLFGWP